MIIINLLAYSCFALTFVVFAKIAEPIKRFFKLKRLKPFDCEVCMAFHTTWILQWSNYSIEHLVLLSSITVVITVTLLSIINAINRSSL